MHEVLIESPYYRIGRAADVFMAVTNKSNVPLYIKKIYAYWSGPTGTQRLNIPLILTFGTSDKLPEGIVVEWTSDIVGDKEVSSMHYTQGYNINDDRFRNMGHFPCAIGQTKIKLKRTLNGGEHLALAAYSDEEGSATLVIECEFMEDEDAVN